MKPLENCRERGGCPLIKFETGGATFAVAIERVREVVEGREIAPYPETARGHLGVVNIRGRVLPVLDPFGRGEAGRVGDGRRLVILERDDGAAFCIVAERVQKILMDQDAKATGGMINVAGRPVRILTDDDFRAWTEGEGGNAERVA